MRKVRSRSNYILKQVAGIEDGAKANLDGTLDRTPMLIRQPASHSGTINRDYLSWQRRRPLPIPKPLEDSAERDTDRVLLTPEGLPTPLGITESLPVVDLPTPSSPVEDMSPSRFSTFRPSQRLEADIRDTPKNAYIVDSVSMHSDTTPYYFKLDPSMSRKGHHMCKPDVVQGCAICLARDRQQQQQALES